MKDYLKKYILFLLPFAIALCVELFFLPIDFFTYRIWESMLMRIPFRIVNGPFYPNMVLSKTEAGDLGYRTAYAGKKDVIWKTDQYGYRKTPMPNRKNRIVIIGDSITAGSSLTQKDILSERLEEKLRTSVYPLAPASGYLNDLSLHALLRNSAPDIVILQIVERNLFYELPMDFPKDLFATEPAYYKQLVFDLRLNPYFQSTLVAVDRLYKANMLQYIKARINENGSGEKKWRSSADKPRFFLQGPSANKPVSSAFIHKTAKSIKAYHDFFTEKGIRFIFLPVPNKETIHYQELNTPKPIFLQALIGRLQDMEVEAIDTQEAFTDITENKSRSLYHLDDSHCNAEGIQVLADLLEDKIRSHSRDRQ